MKKRQLFSKILIWSAVFCLLFSAAPVTAFAGGSASGAGTVEQSADILPGNIQPLGNFPYAIGEDSGAKNFGTAEYNAYFFSLTQPSDVQFTFEHQQYTDNTELCAIWLDDDTKLGVAYDDRNIFGVPLNFETTYAQKDTHAGAIVPAWLPATTITYYNLPAGGPYYFVVRTESAHLGAAQTGWYSFSSQYVMEVSFMGNGGPDMGKKTVPYQGTYGALPVPEERPGYVFLGWFTAAAGGAQVTENTPVTVNADHSLYARWQQTIGTITFDANGGSLSAADGTRRVSIGSTLGTLPMPTRAGYTLKGWFTSPSGGDQVGANTVVTADATYYAQWIRWGKATSAQLFYDIADVAYSGGAKGVRVTPHPGVGKVTVYYTGISGVRYAKSTKKPKAIGSYRVTVNVARGDQYDAARNIILGSFKIIPRSPIVTLIKPEKKQMTVKWKKISAVQKAVKYQLRYRVKGTTKWKTRSFHASVTSATIKNLKKGKTYEVEMRSQSKMSGRTYTGAWSKTKISKRIR